MKHLLLLHGAIGSREQLYPLADKLKNSFIVHTINFSGHGGEPMPELFTIELFANDVLNYLKSKNISNITIYGYSMGGYVALYLAKHYPEKISKVITFATKFLWTSEIAQREIKMLDAIKIAEKIPGYAKTLEKRHYPGDWKNVLQKTIGMMIALGEYNSLSTHDIETIECPVLIGIGDKDNMVTLEESIDVYRKLKNADFMVLPNTSHPIEKADTERLSAAIELFLKPVLAVEVKQ